MPNPLCHKSRLARVSGRTSACTAGMGIRASQSQCLHSSPPAGRCRGGSVGASEWGSLEAPPDPHTGDSASAVTDRGKQTNEALGLNLAAINA